MHAGRSLAAPRSLFGDLVIIVFLVCQALDGMFTYVGLQRFGPSIEANPVIAAALPYFGGAATLAVAKLVAASFGIALHLSGVHRVVAALTALYVAAAVTPWAVLLLAG
ncbi:MAG: DUF5658 family protein [Bacteroidales bacterium]